MGSLTKKLKKNDENRKLKTTREAYTEGYAKGLQGLEDAYRRGHKDGAMETIKFYHDLTVQVETLHEIPGIGPERYRLILEHLTFPFVDIEESRKSGIKSLSRSSQADDELETNEQLTAF